MTKQMDSTCDMCGSLLMYMPDLYDDGTESRTWSIRCPHRCHEKEAEQRRRDWEGTREGIVIAVLLAGWALAMIFAVKWWLG